MKNIRKRLKVVVERRGGQWCIVGNLSALSQEDMRSPKVYRSSLTFRRSVLGWQFKLKSLNPIDYEYSLCPIILNAISVVPLGNLDVAVVISLPG